MEKLRILVVDDSPISSQRIATMLTTFGHEAVHTCASGLEAVEAYRQFHPDMVTMDITMPGMNGVDATTQIINEHPDALIVMITSQGQEMMVLSALEAGAKGYILKPIRVDKLKATIEDLAQHRKTSQ